MNVVIKAKYAASEKESLTDVDEQARGHAKDCDNLICNHGDAREDEQDCTGVLCGFEGFVGHGYEGVLRHGGKTAVHGLGGYASTAGKPACTDFR